MEDPGEYNVKNKREVEEPFIIEEPRESYGAYITHDILSNEALNDRQKILYARIHNLANKKGYCYASNEWFAEKMNISIPTIKRDLKLLRDQNLIKQVMKTTKNGAIRLIYLGGGQITGDLGGQLTSDPTHIGINIIDVNKKETKNKEKPVGPLISQKGEIDFLPNEKEIDNNEKKEVYPRRPLSAAAIEKEKIKKLRTNNEKLFKYMPKTVEKKPVTLEELEFFEKAVEVYNEVRQYYFKKKGLGCGMRNPTDTKTCGHYVLIFRLFRDNYAIYHFRQTLNEMFEAYNHKENNWGNLSLEFVSRPNKFDNYYNQWLSKNIKEL